MKEKYVGLKTCPSCKELQNSIKEECSNCGHDFTKVPTVSDNKQRHGFLTAWLIAMIIINSILIPVYLAKTDMVKQGAPEAPEWIFLLFAVMSAFNAICGIALLIWKKWGFYGLCVNAVISVSIGFGFGILGLIFAPVSVGTLFCLLNIGKERKAWSRLE